MVILFKNSDNYVSCQSSVYCMFSLMFNFISNLWAKHCSLK